jgi:hypothetical protein
MMGTANMHRTAKGEKATYSIRLLHKDNMMYEAYWSQYPNVRSTEWGTEDEALAELVYIIENRGK